MRGDRDVCRHRDDALGHGKPAQRAQNPPERLLRRALGRVALFELGGNLERRGTGPRGREERRELADGGGPPPLPREAGPPPPPAAAPGHAGPVAPPPRAERAGI